MEVKIVLKEGKEEEEEGKVEPYSLKGREELH